MIYSDWGFGVKMKKKLSIIALCLVVVMCFTALVACDVSGIELDTPVVKINRNGLASWKAVDNAKSYVCNVSGREVETMYTIMQLKDGESISVKAVSGGSPYKNSKWSETKTYNASSGGNQGESGKIKLATPVVTISQSGLASWDSVANASEYEYTINGTTVGKTTHTNIQLEAGQTIFVKALGTGNYTDSDPSAIQKYEKPCEHVDADNDGKCDKCGKDTAINECDHIDANDDEICDNCSENVVVSFNLFAINDLHGMYCDTDTQPGVDELTTYLKDYQANTNTIVLSSGDMWQGSSESNNTKGKLATEWLNYIGCSSMTLGNHEFDWSTEKIKSNAQLANFPFLAINVYDKSTNKRADYCDASVVVEFGDAKIGIIGAIGDCYSSISASMCSDVEFKVGDDLTTLVKQEANRLRAQGVDYVVYSLHDGGRQSDTMDWYDTSLSNGYVDIVFEGHTHQAYCYDDNYGVYHIQGGGYNKGISTATVRLNFANQKFSTQNYGVIYNSVYSKCASDSIVEELVEKYKSEIGDPDEVVATLTKSVPQETIEDKIADLYCERGLAEWGDKYDIVLGGGFVRTRSPKSLSKGAVTVSDIQTLLPFENKIVLCSLNGTQINNKFINTSNEDYHVSYTSYGLTVKDKVLYNSTKTYYIVTDTYTSDYHHLNVIATLDGNVFAYTLLCDYLRGGGTF